MFHILSGLLCDLLWSDPDKDTNGWGENDRGVSFTFGADVVSKFLNRHDLDLICRAHQVSLTKDYKLVKLQKSWRLVVNCSSDCCLWWVNNYFCFQKWKFEDHCKVTAHYFVNWGINRIVVHEFGCWLLKQSWEQDYG